MKHIRHLISVLTLSFIIFAGINVCAEKTYSPETDFKITEDGAITYVGSDRTVIIPPTVNGIKVTAIDDFAFCYNYNVTEITVPEDVTHIYSDAFNGCSNLERLDLPMKLEYVGSNVLEYTKILEDFESSGEEGFLQLGSCIFASNYSTIDMYTEKHIKIPDSVTVIADNAFNTVNTMSFDLPKNIKYIGNNAFYNNLLTASKIIDNVAYEDRYALYARAAFEDSDGYVTTRSENVNIKPGTEVLGAYLFNDILELRSVNIPKSVTKIPEGLFYNAMGLKKVTWHNYIEEIGKVAFYQTNLGSIALPLNLKKIGQSAFENANLTEILMFENVTKIEKNAFSSNPKLTDIYYTGSEEQWNEIEIAHQGTLGYLTSVNIHYNYDPAGFYPDNMPGNINNVTLIGGGTAYGRYFVRDLRGIPAQNCNVLYKIDGGDAIGAITDAEGYLKIPIDNIYETKDYQIEIYSLVTRKVDDVLSVTVKPASFTSTYEAVIKGGAKFSLSAGAGMTLGPVELNASLLEVGAGGSLSKGLSFKQNYSDEKNKVSITTKTDADAFANAKIGIFADADFSKCLSLEATAVEAGGTATIGISGGVTYTNEDFDINDENDINEISKFLLASILEANGSNVITREIIEKLDITTDSYEFGNTLVLDGNVSAGIIGTKNDDYIADAEVTLYGVNGKASWSNSSTFNADGTTEYESSFVNGSGDKVLDFEIKTASDGNLKGGGTIKSTQKSTNNVSLKAVHNENSHLEELSFTARESKQDGVLWNTETTETSYTVSYPMQSAGSVSVQNTWLSSFSRGDTAIISNSDWQDISDIMLNNTARADYCTQYTSKKGTDLDFGFGGGAGVKIGVSAGMSGVESFTYTTEKGFIENGDIYIQSDCMLGKAKEQRITISDIMDKTETIMLNMLTNLMDAVTGVVEDKVDAAMATIESIGNAAGKTATISYTKQDIEPMTVLLLSDEQDEFSTSSGVVTVGNPYVIEIKENDQVIESFDDIKLTIRYTDDMVTGIDENCISIARWDENKCVYTTVYSNLDCDNNKVTAQITKPGQYILLADTLPPAITGLKVEKDCSDSPEIFAIISDISGISDFKLILNEETVIDIKNFEQYYDYSTGIFRYTANGLDDNYYYGQIYAKDSRGYESTKEIEFSVDNYKFTPDSISVPDKLTNGCEIIVNGDLWEASYNYVCARATDSNGVKYTRNFPVLSREIEENDEYRTEFYAVVEDLPANVDVNLWAESYLWNGNCGKTEITTYKTAPIELLITENLKNCVTVECSNTTGLNSSCKIYASVYDNNNVMIGVQSGYAKDKITFTELPSGATVKAFLLDGVKPVCESTKVVE